MTVLYDLLTSRIAIATLWRHLRRVSPHQRAWRCIASTSCS